MLQAIMRTWLRDELPPCLLVGWLCPHTSSPPTHGSLYATFLHPALFWTLSNVSRRAPALIWTIYHPALFSTIITIYHPALLWTLFNVSRRAPAPFASASRIALRFEHNTWSSVFCCFNLSSPLIPASCTSAHLQSSMPLNSFLGRWCQPNFPYLWQNLRDVNPKNTLFYHWALKSNDAVCMASSRK